MESMLDRLRYGINGKEEEEEDEVEEEAERELKPWENGYANQDK